MTETRYDPDWRRRSYGERRWPGDTYPEALQAYADAREDEAEAWDAVVKAATSMRDGVRIDRFPEHLGLPDLVEHARSLRPATLAAWVAKRQAQDADPPRRRA